MSMSVGANEQNHQRHLVIKSRVAGGLFATIVLAWERKADKKQLAALEKRVRKLEQQVVRVTVLQERKK